MRVSWPRLSRGGQNARACIRLTVSRGRESIGLRGLAQILAAFYFVLGLKTSQIGAKCPSRLPNEHYATAPWLSGVFWGCFVSLKGLLFGDGIQMIRGRQWCASDHLSHADECFQWKSYVPSKSKSPWQMTISSFMHSTVTVWMPAVKKPSFSYNPHKFPST